MEKSSQEIFIKPEYAVNILCKTDNKKYATIPRLFRCIAYVAKAANYRKDVIYDISFNSIERSVRRNQNAISTIGDTIVLKDEPIPEMPGNVLQFLAPYVNKFSKTYPA